MAPANWELVVCGISHKTSSLEQREPLQIGHEEMADAIDRFRALPGVLEATIVATCNRIEFYCITRAGYEPFDMVAAFYEEFRGIDLAELKGSFYIRRNKHVAYHLFHVTAGMDSMVLGENQIVGQVKDAYSSACAVKAAGKVLHRLFHQAFRVGKQIRTDTEMGQGACSVSSASIELLRKKHNHGRAPVVLFVGLNQMIALAASGLSKWDGARLMFANRTPGKAVSFAARYGASGHSLGELPDLLAKADVVVSCTGASEPVIVSDMIREAVAKRMDRHLTIMDLAIPRDVEWDETGMANVSVYDLEDVRQFVKEQQHRREEAIPAAEEIIDRKLNEFMYWFDHVRHEPLYTEMGESFEEIRRGEMEPVLQKLDPHTRKKVDFASRRLVDRLLSLKLQEINRSDTEG